MAMEAIIPAKDIITAMEDTTLDMAITMATAHTFRDMAITMAMGPTDKEEKITKVKQKNKPGKNSNVSESGNLLPLLFFCQFTFKGYNGIN